MIIRRVYLRYFYKIHPAAMDVNYARIYCHQCNNYIYDLFTEQYFLKKLGYIFIYLYIVTYAISHMPSIVSVDIH